MKIPWYGFFPNQKCAYQTVPKLLELDNVNLVFEPVALLAIAKEAIKRNTGARGLRAIIEGIMLEIMYEVPSREDVTNCVITEEVVEKRVVPELSQSKDDKQEESA